MGCIGFITACGHQQFPPPKAPAASVSGLERNAEMSSEEVLQKFRERASSNELQKFEQLRRAKNVESRMRALEIVLARLTYDELFKIGINEIEQSGRKLWLVATSRDSKDVMDAVHKVLTPLGIDVDTSFDLAMCGWRVPSEDFFRAQRALLSATNLQALAVEVHQPTFRLK